MTSIPHDALMLAPHLRANSEVPEAVEKQQPANRDSWAPCELFVRKRLGVASPALSGLAQTLDYCADYISDSGIFWTMQRKAIGPWSRLGTYEEVLEPWFTGLTLQERMKGLRAFCGGTVYGSCGEEAPPLTNETLLRSLVDAEFKKKYFGGNKGFIQGDVVLIRKAFEQRVMRPCALLHIRKFVDFMIGKHDDLAIAQAAVKCLLPSAHPDHYEQLLRGEAKVVSGIAKKIFDALLLVRKILKDPDYGAALYEPRRLERSEGIAWKLGVAAGLAAAGFFCGLVHVRRRQTRGHRRFSLIHGPTGRHEAALGRRLSDNGCYVNSPTPDKRAHPMRGAEQCHFVFLKGAIDAVAVGLTGAHQDCACHDAGDRPWPIGAAHRRDVSKVGPRSGGRLSRQQRLA